MSWRPRGRQDTPPDHPGYGVFQQLDAESVKLNNVYQIWRLRHNRRAEVSSVSEVGGAGVGVVVGVGVGVVVVVVGVGACRRQRRQQAQE